MQTISDFKKSDNLIKHKKDFFSKNLESKSFFLLIKPTKNIYKNAEEKELVEKQLEKLIKIGFLNIEISWSDNEKWFDYVSNLKLKFPKLNLGSASIINKKSIDDSIRLGLNYSMMKVWDKDLLNYSRSKNHLLIPGIKNLKDLKEAIDLHCKIIKIYPVKDKNKLIKISQYKNIDFIAAGGLSIVDVPLYKSLGYKAIVIGDKGFKNKVIDPNIYEWIQKTSN
ncbi:possible 2-keto-3-deoxy-6-phosphogluconate aldolase [Prochlorococcus marinus str. MIT 9515]|uniref:Possible 2-keto-3-deoxy-6-phosphogluconate aldolase n=1 Tax=Prochlorococcus marinus (strain MIT 9515) TaxID=167542 RepID=A2BUK5_PROM5|nr:bifunctional 4-hydroxy-2-oxoglutarate aldolase/2-dehydro-3-deoxy-phosphogluconate aldolase [Prochlorococcus marinus]ABM71466.1 possible 2-keto-3-deoxy-6-phosphogluconate aldolase [Prochlorococcus marinus str. MIT 9515]